MARNYYDNNNGSADENLAETFGFDEVFDPSEQGESFDPYADVSAAPDSGIQAAETDADGNDSSASVSHTKSVAAAVAVGVVIVGAVILSISIFSKKGLETDDSAGEVYSRRTIATGGAVIEQEVIAESVQPETTATNPSPVTPSVTSASTTAAATTTAATTTKTDYNAIVTPNEKEFIRTMYVNHKYESLRMRSGPDKRYKIVYEGIPAGQGVDVVAEIYNEGEKDTWAYVTYNGYSGWASESCMWNKPTEVYPQGTNPSGIMYADVDEEGLQLRYGPGFDYEKKDLIKRHNKVEIYANYYDPSTGETWVYVLFNKKYGWVCKKYLISKLPETTTKKTTTTTTSAKTEPPTETSVQTSSESSSADDSGQSIPTSVPIANFSAVYADTSYDGYSAGKVIDLDLNTCWKMPWNDEEDYELALIASEPQTINTIYIYNGDKLAEEAEYHIRNCEFRFDDGSKITAVLEYVPEKRMNKITLSKTITTSTLYITIKSVVAEEGSVPTDLSIAEIFATNE